MADNFKRNKKQELEFLQIQNDIADAQDRNSKSLETYWEAKKAILENAKLIKITEAEIAVLLEQNTKESLKEAEALKTQVTQLKQINKQAANLATGLRAVGNQLYTKLVPGFDAIYDKSMSVDKAIRNTTASLGISSGQMAVMRDNIKGASMRAEALNITTEELVEAQKNYADETGRATILSSAALGNMAELAKATDMTVGAMGSLTGQMEAFGFGAERSIELVRDVRDIAESQGVNAGKVMKKFQQNLKLLNKLDFKGGAKGMAKMAAFSEKYKLSMEAVAGVADKVFRPEGAIEAAANLQMLGGSLSQLGDPFTLMYKARYAPEELAKSLSSAAAQSAVFNKETGEWELNALELDRMKEAANALGIPMEELVATAKRTAKMDSFKGMMPSSWDKDDRELLAGMAQMKDGKGTIEFLDKDGIKQTKTLSQMTPELIKSLKEGKKNTEELARQNQTFDEAWKGLQGQLKALASEFLLPFLNWVKPMITWLTDLVKGMPTWLKTFTGGALLLGKVAFDTAKWIYNGVMLRKGFNMGNKTDKVTDALTGDKSQSKTFTPKSRGMVTDSKGNKWGKNTPQGKMIRTKGGTQPLKPMGKQSGIGTSAGGKGGGGKPGGMTKGMNMKNVLQGAAAILVLSAALFVFAKALQEFDKLENGWETLAQAAVGMTLLAGGLWAISAIPKKDILVGALALAVMGAAMIPFAYAMGLMEGISWETLGVAAASLVVFGAAMFALGAIMFTGVGALIFGAGILAFIALGGALAIFGIGLQQVVAPITEFSGSMETLTNIDFSKAVNGIVAIGEAMTNLESNGGLDSLRETAMWLSIMTI
jgi:hypothetical protein